MERILRRHVMKAARDGEGAAAYHKASPLSRIHAGAPPFLVVHGELDTLVPVAAARTFVATPKRPRSARRPGKKSTRMKMTSPWRWASRRRWCDRPRSPCICRRQSRDNTRWLRVTPANPFEDGGFFSPALPSELDWQYTFPG